MGDTANQTKDIANDVHSNENWRDSLQPVPAHAGQDSLVLHTPLRMKNMHS
jgi:hypothetical protein